MAIPERHFGQGLEHLSILRRPPWKRHVVSPFRHHATRDDVGREHPEHIGHSDDLVCWRRILLGLKTLYEALHAMLYLISGEEGRSKGPGDRGSAQTVNACGTGCKCGTKDTGEVVVPGIFV